MFFPSYPHTAQKVKLFICFREVTERRNRNVSVGEETNMHFPKRLWCRSDTLELILTHSNTPVINMEDIIYNAPAVKETDGFSTLKEPNLINGEKFKLFNHRCIECSDKT